MKKTIVLFLFVLLALSIVAFDTLRQNGIAGRTGSPGETTCTACHGAASTGTISISISPSFSMGYMPGSSYTISVTVSESGRSRFGFDCEALTAGNTNGGTLAVIAGTTDVKTLASGTKTNITHTGTGNSTANSHTFNFRWTAPASGSGTITFYTAGIAANGDGIDNAADHTYKTSLPVSEMTMGVSQTNLSDIRLSVFPNPASEKITLSYMLEKNDHVSARLYSISGSASYDLFSEMQNEGQQNKEVMLPELVSGIYLLRFSVGTHAIYSVLMIH